MWESKQCDISYTKVSFCVVREHVSSALMEHIVHFLSPTFKKSWRVPSVPTVMNHRVGKMKQRTSYPIITS
jgi:hypothetical protein